MFSLFMVVSAVDYREYLPFWSTTFSLAIWAAEGFSGIFLAMIGPRTIQGVVLSLFKL